MGSKERNSSRSTFDLEHVALPRLKLSESHAIASVGFSVFMVTVSFRSVSRVNILVSPSADATAFRMRTNNFPCTRKKKKEKHLHPQEQPLFYRCFDRIVPYVLAWPPMSKKVWFVCPLGHRGGWPR